MVYTKIIERFKGKEGRLILLSIPIETWIAVAIPITMRMEIKLNE